MNAYVKPDPFINGIDAFNRREFEEAIPHLQNEVTRKPDNVRAWSTLGRCYVEMNAFVRARHAYENASRFAQGEELGEALYWRGHCESALGEYSEARQLLREALDLLPNDPEGFRPYALVELGNALYKAGELNEAVLVLNEAILSRPDHANAIKLRAHIAHRTGGWIGWIRAYPKLLRLNKTSNERWRNQA